MNRLDEIEKGLKQSLSIAYNDVSPNRSRHERNIELLSQAVRQLGARHNAMMEIMTSKYAKTSLARNHPIDADVLALLKKEKE